MSATPAVSARGDGQPGFGRLADALRRRPALCGAIAVFGLAVAGLLIARHPERPALVPARAAAALRADSGYRHALRGQPVTRIQVMPLDSHLDQVIAYDGLRMVYQADVSVRGVVLAATDLRGSKPAFGSEIANHPLVLGLLTAVFMLAGAVWPLWRLHNLDLLVAASLVSSVVLVNAEVPVLLAIAVYPALLYLAARCAWLGLGPARAPAPSVPLLDRLTEGWTFHRRRRLLRMLAGATGLTVAMVGLSSLHVVDVGYAVMEGATVLLHGVLPYGHIPDVLHGDTYPLASYLLYVPFAWIDPVHTAWDDADFTLAVAVAAALAVAVMLVWTGRVGRRTPPDEAASRARPDEAAERRQLAALRAAIAWLSFPTLLVTVSTGTTDPVLGVLLVGALLAWRRPALCTGILAAGGWFKLVPVALVPLALARLRGRSLGRAALVIAAVSAPLVALMVWLGGLRGPVRMLAALTFQQTRRSPRDLWSMIGSVPGQTLAQALTVALIAGVAIRLGRDHALAGDRTRMAALFGAVLLGVQISANYWSSFYLSWVVPFLVLSLLRTDATWPTT